MGRIRATSSEWRQYYEKAARFRCLHPDPVLRMLRRRKVLGRIGTCGASCAIVFTFAVLVVGSLWLWNHLNLKPVAEMVFID